MSGTETEIGRKQRAWTYLGAVLGAEPGGAGSESLVFAFIQSSSHASL